ncbi:MAG: hypothetical protein C0457_02055 [Polymorphum sp.]|jgi:hypothetical protein|nr:hypothetical protein [Polymorphum sp.]
MTRQKWPKRDGGPTLEQYARRWLAVGQRSPFDAHIPQGDADLVLPDHGDWATHAARGIIAEFGDRGAFFKDAFNDERIPEEVRIEIIDVMAALMREALRQERDAGKDAQS